MKGGRNIEWNGSIFSPLLKGLVGLVMFIVFLVVVVNCSNEDAKLSEEVSASPPPIILSDGDAEKEVRQLNKRELAIKSRELSKAVAKYRNHFQFRAEYNREEYLMNGELYLLRDILPDYREKLPLYIEIIEKGIKLNKVYLVPFIYVRGGGKHYVHQQFYEDENGKLETYELVGGEWNKVDVDALRGGFMQLILMPYPNVQFADNKYRKEFWSALRVNGSPCACSPGMSCWEGQPKVGEVYCGETDKNGDCPAPPSLCCGDGNPEPTSVNN